MIAENYKQVLIKIKKELRLWAQRDITVLGKITVLKSLLSSKLVYLFLTFPNPPADYVKELNQLFF